METDSGDLDHEETIQLLGGIIYRMNLLERLLYRRVRRLARLSDADARALLGRISISQKINAYKDVCRAHPSRICTAEEERSSLWEALRQVNTGRNRFAHGVFGRSQSESGDPTYFYDSFRRQSVTYEPRRFEHPSYLRTMMEAMGHLVNIFCNIQELEKGEIDVGFIDADNVNCLKLIDGLNLEKAA